ncbi:MAG: NTP transferase domain-containing protein, partial [Nitrospirota bacterium]|nr:NTP transferase domain-containing protein [Nitrospirota bacterium]
MRPGSPQKICDKTICGVVLAGGKSRRMGENKSLISFKRKPLIEHATDVLSRIFSEVVIVCDAQSHAENRFAHLPFPILCDQR